MAKPIIKPIEPFDKNLGTSIYTTYSGRIPTNHEVIIKDATSLKVVYTKLEQSAAISPAAVIPKNKLQNGKRYCITIQFDKGLNTESAVSDPVYFMTVRTPVFEFVDLNPTETNIVVNSEMIVEVHYDKPNGESLDTLQFTMFDSDHKVFSRSKVIANPSDYSYKFRGLENDTVYYLQAKGRTVHGIEMQTPVLQLLVRYNDTTNNAYIHAESDPNGTVNGYTNIILIEPTKPRPEDHTFSGGWVDLRDDYLEYIDQFLFSGNFTISMRIKNMKANALIMKLGNKNDFITLNSFTYDGLQRFKLTATGFLDDYVIYSEGYNIVQEQVVCIHIRRKNNVYQLVVVTNQAEQPTTLSLDDDEVFYGIDYDMADNTYDINKELGGNE